MNHTVLIADDEKEIRDLLRLYLENEGYRIIEAADGMEAVNAVKEKHPDICLLDIMMPGKDGLSVLKEIRDESNIPVIMISAKTADVERILGLNLGADDYIPKPFNPLEVAARVKSNLRRYYDLGSGKAAAETFTVKDLVLDTDSCTLTKGGVPLQLTSVEYKIMEMFMRYPGKVFTKQQIYECGWDDEYVVSDNNIMVSISKLRTKLDEDPSKYITTLRGLGYRMEK